MLSPSFAEFTESLLEIIKILRTIKKNRRSLSSDSFYSKKVRSCLANLRKTFIILQKDYTPERYPKVSYQLAVVEPLIQKVISIYPGPVQEMIKLADEINFKLHSDLAAEVEAAESNPIFSTTTAFIPNDLIQERQYILKKVLWEINRCYDAECYNGCAILARRLMESLIIDCYEGLGMEKKIKNGEDYFDLSKLIGLAVTEPKFKLTRNTKKIFPELKFLGDLGAHNRKALVRKEDIDRLHQAMRSAVEELVNQAASVTSTTNVR